MGTGTEMSAKEVLQSAIRTLEQKGSLRDTPDGERTLGETAELFAQLSGIQLSASEAHVFMIALKLVRMKRKPLFDDMIDLINYIALLAEEHLKLLNRNLDA